MPKAIAPTVAAINIVKFNKSDIQTALGCFASLGILRRRPLIKTGNVRCAVGKIYGAAQASLRLSQKIGRIDPYFYWQIEYL